MATDEKTKAATDLFEQATRSFEQALKTGIRLQEESTRVWSGLVAQASTPQEWPKRLKALSEELVPQTQRAMRECVKLVEQHCTVSVDLLKKAISAAQAGSVPEAQSKFLGLWEGSLNAVRDSALAVIQANSRAAESWMDYSRKVWETGTAKP
jgi:hypothetical protein